MLKCLILVDLQNDFLPGGAFPVPHADALVPLANQLQSAFRLVVATQDWHPLNHKCFAANHPGTKPGSIMRTRKQPRVLYPVHCVQNTRGAELAPGLRMNRVHKIFRKGTDPEIDSYSAFFDVDHLQPTGLHDYLQEKGVTDVYVMGLATEYAVKATILDALGFGLRAHLLVDACRGRELRPEAVEKAVETMTQAGAVSVRSSTLAAL